MNQALYRLRALKMIELRLKGISLVAIGKEFGVSDQTVARSLKWAETNGLIESFEDQILNELVPAAMKTLREAMVDGKNADVALEVFKGIGLFKKHTDKTVTKPGADEDLESYLRSKRQVAGQSVQSAGALPPKPEVRVLEGQLAEAGPENPPPATSGVVQAGDEDSVAFEDGAVDGSEDFG